MRLARPYPPRRRRPAAPWAILLPAGAPLLGTDVSVTATSVPPSRAIPTPQHVDYDWLLRSNNDPSSESYALDGVCWDEYRRDGDGGGGGGGDEHGGRGGGSGEVCGIEIGNGLIARRFLVRELSDDGGDSDVASGDNTHRQKPASSFLFGTVDLTLTTAPIRGGHLKAFRATSPEATLRISLSDDNYHREREAIVGDLTQGDLFAGYCNRTAFFDALRPLPLSCSEGEDDDYGSVVFRYRGGHRIYDRILVDESEGAPPARLPAEWRPGRRGSSPSLRWPPGGKTLAVDFEPDDGSGLEGLVVRVHYEVYDGIPTMGKYVRVLTKGRGGGGAGGSTWDKRTVLPPAESRAPHRRLRILNVQTELLNVYPPFGPHIGGAYVPYDPKVRIRTSTSAIASDGAADHFRPLPWLRARTSDAHGSGCTWEDGRERENRTEEYGTVQPFLRCGYFEGGGPGVFVNLEAPREGAAPGEGVRVEAEAMAVRERERRASTRSGDGASASGSNEDYSSSSFTGHAVYLTLMDSRDPDRHRFAQHRADTVLLPHVFENPLFFHLTDLRPQSYDTALDQVVEAGFEMIFFSFGTSFHMETNDTNYLRQIRGLVDKARKRGVEVGGYDLIVLERGKGGYGSYVGDAFSVVIEDDGGGGTNATKLGPDACLASGWADCLDTYLDRFLSATGLSAVELDGPYGGSACASRNHSHHFDEKDSIYRQNLRQARLMSWLQRRGAYVNQPDNYFDSGGSMTGMGYDENQYSLPREVDMQVSRMTMADDLTVLTQPAGWMHVPVAQYHGGGRDAEFQPSAAGGERPGSGVTRETNRDYALALAQYLGSGVGAAYRGPWLWDPDGPSVPTPAPPRSDSGVWPGLTDVGIGKEPEMKGVLRDWVAFFKRHRGTLTHGYYQSLRRADSQMWDGWLVSNPLRFRSVPTEAPDEIEPSAVVGVAVVLNPSARRLDRDTLRSPPPLIQIPVYYMLGGKADGTRTALRVVINEVSVTDGPTGEKGDEIVRVLPVQLDWSMLAEPFVQLPVDVIDYGPRSANTIVFYDDAS